MGPGHRLTHKARREPIPAEGGINNLKRINIQLTDEQEAQIRKLSFETRKSVAEHVRRAVQLYLKTLYAIDEEVERLVRGTGIEEPVGIFGEGKE